MATTIASFDLWDCRSLVENLQNVERQSSDARRCLRRFEKEPRGYQSDIPKVVTRHTELEIELETPEADVSIVFQRGQTDLENMVSIPGVQHGRTTSPFFIADLIIDGADAPGVKFADISLSCKTQDKQFSVLQGFQYLASRETDQCNIDRLYLKALDKGTKAVARVAQFLQRPAFSQTDAGLATNTIQQEVELSRVLAQSAVLIGGPPCEGHARNIEGISSFHQVDFSFPARSEHTERTTYKSSQLIHFSCPTLNADARLFGLNGKPDYERVDIVSGVCLYNSNIMQRSQIVNGGLQKDQLLSNEPTLYEMEYIARSSTAVADFASHILSNVDINHDQRQVGGKLPVCINLDVPSFHYYAAIDRLVKESQITTNEALQWLESVIARSEKMAEVFRGAVSKEIKTRLRVDHLPSNLTFSISPARSSIVWSCLQNSLRNGSSPNIQDTLERLANEGDDSWNLFLSLMPAKDHPQDFRELGYTFYVYQCIRPALMRTRRSDAVADPQSGKRRQLLLSVDDGIERKIYSRAQKLLKKIRRLPQESMAQTELIEAYLSRRIFIDSNKAGSNLYLDDPSPEKPRSLQPESYETGVFEDHPEDSSQVAMKSLPVGGSQLTPFEIIAALHGRDYASGLWSLFEEVGLAG